MKANTSAEGTDKAVEVGVLAENKKKINNADKAIRSAQERRRKLIESSKLFTYDVLSELYGKEGQELIDAVTAEHTLICKLTESGMTFEQIGELADGGSADADTVGQTSFFGDQTYKD